MKLLFFVLSVIFTITYSSFGLDEAPYYRIGQLPKVDILSCWEPEIFPAWPTPENDHVSMTFMGVGRFNNKTDLKKKDTYVWEGKASAQSETFDLNSKIEPLGKHSFRYSVSVRNFKNIKDEYGKPFIDLTFNENMLGRKLKFFFEKDGKKNKQSAELPFPAEKTFIQDFQNICTGVQFPMIQGLVSVEGFRATVWGLKYGPGMANLRFYLTPDSEGNCDAVFTVKMEPFKTESFDLSKIANMGFADEVESDGKGGWTDQGPANDLRMLKPGRQRFGNMDFTILNPAENAGKACLVFANSALPQMLNEVELPGKGRKIPFLYILHTAAWCSGNGKNAGTIQVDFMDGESIKIPVTIGKDVGNWWRPVNLKNGWPVFLAEGASCPEVGFQMSRFPIPEKAIRTIRLKKSADNTVWIVLALNGAFTEDIPFSLKNQAEIEWKVSAGKDWREIRVPQTLPDSILDFSFLQDAPAGKYGKVVVRNGRFEFEKRPGVQARFFGANLCEDACHMTDEEIAWFIPKIKQMGFNAVRLHHHDNRLALPEKTLQIDPKTLDRFFKTVAACKEAGLYITTDLFVSRKNGFDPKYHKGIKALCMLDPAVRNNLKEFSRQLFATRNPYTKMTLAEDPVLLSISHINENPQLTDWSEITTAAKDSYLYQVFLTRFSEWSTKNNVKNNPDDISLLTRFLTDMHKESFLDMKNYLRSIGVSCPQTDINCQESLANYPIRKTFDYVDTHFYVDHPTFPVAPWRIPFEYKNRSLGKTFYQELLPSFASRIEGMPLMITEYHYVSPNIWRLEGGPIIGALSGMHQVDGIFDFAPVAYDRSWIKIAMSSEPPYMPSLNSFWDPVTSLSNRITALLYLREDMPASVKKYSLSIPDNLSAEPNALTWRRPSGKRHLLPESYSKLALYSSLSIRFNAQENEITFPLSTAINADTDILLKKIGLDPKKEICSADGGIRAFPKENRFIVISPKTETLTLQEPSGTAKNLSITGNKVFSTYSASAMDNKPLEKSRRILILHITDVKNGKNSYKMYKDKLRVYGWGGYPLLLRKAKAQVSLKNTAEGIAELYAIDITGKRLNSVPFTEKNGVLIFTADNTLGDTPSIGYELIRK